MAAALLRQLQQELDETLRIAVMLADGVSREEAARRLGVNRHALERVCERLERAIPLFDRDDEQAPRSTAGAP